MGKYSRTAKYEDLRNQMQSSSESEISSTDLTEFTKKLAQLDSDDSFEDNHDPIHARRAATLETPKVENTGSFNKVEEVPVAFDTDSLVQKNKEDLATFDNEYLDEYISEVKQYNKDKGLLYSTDTQINILEELKGNKTPSKPIENTGSIFDKPSSKAGSKTTDIPFVQEQTVERPVVKTKVETSLEDTRNNIAAQVQGFASQEPVASFDDEEDDDSMAKVIDLDAFRAKNTDTGDIESRLLNETSQLKVQLDEYSEDLNDVNDKVEHSNRILNFVLVILIFALVVVLAVVIYWILLAKGII